MLSTSLHLNVVLSWNLNEHLLPKKHLAAEHAFKIYLPKLGPPSHSSVSTITSPFVPSFPGFRCKKVAIVMLVPHHLGSDPTPIEVSGKILIDLIGAGPGPSCRYHDMLLLNKICEQSNLKRWTTGLVLFGKEDK